MLYKIQIRGKNKAITVYADSGVEALKRLKKTGERRACRIVAAKHSSWKGWKRYYGHWPRRK